MFSIPPPPPPFVISVHSERVRPYIVLPIWETNNEVSLHEFEGILPRYLLHRFETILSKFGHTSFHLWIIVDNTIEVEFSQNVHFTYINCCYRSYSFFFKQQGYLCWIQNGKRKILLSEGNPKINKTNHKLCEGKKYLIIPICQVAQNTT